MARAARTRLWLVLAMGSLSLVCAVLAIGVGLRVAELKRRGPALLARSLGESLGLRARVGSVELTFPGLYVVASDLTLERPGGERVLTARKLSFWASWRGLLDGKLDMHAPLISGAVLRLKGEDPLLEQAARALSATRSQLVPGDGPRSATAAFADTRLVIALANGSTLELETAHIGARALKNSVEVHVEGARGALTFAAGRHALSAFVLRGDFSPAGLRIARASAEVAGARLSLRRAQGGLTLEGTLSRPPFAGSRIKATVAVAQGALQLSELTLTGGSGVQLAGAARLRADGTAELALREAALQGVPLGPVSAELRIREGGRCVEVMHLTAGQLASDGLMLHFDRGLARLDGSLRAQALPLERLYRWLGAGDDPLLGRLRGTASGNAELAYRRQSEGVGVWSVRLTLALLRPELAGYGFDAGELAWRLQTGRGAAAFELEALRLRAGGGVLALSGKRAQDGALALEASFERLPLGRVPFFKVRAPALDGHLDGRFTLRGTAAEPELEIELAVDDARIAQQRIARARLQAHLRGAEPNGEIRVQALELGEGAWAVRAPVPIELRVTKGKVALAGAALLGSKLALRLGADGDLTHGVRVRLDGSVPAQLFAPAQPGLKVYGELALQAALDPARKPWLSGEARPAGVVVQLPGGMLVRKLTGKLILAGDSVAFQDVRAEFGGGEVGLGGHVKLDGLRTKRYDLAISAKAVTLEPQPRVELLVDADTKLRSGEAGGPPELSGVLRVQRLVYGRHLQLPEALAALNREQRARSQQPPRLRFDLAIEPVGPLLVRNNLLDLELVGSGREPRLRVLGNDRNFGVLGALAVQRGRVLFRGDEFQVTRGKVTFVNAERLDPQFDVRALATRRKRPDANIVFLARGDRDAFEIDVRCDAPPSTRTPPPFSCDYANDTLRCDSFEELVTLWVCRS